MSNQITGTVAELVAKGLTFNGVLVDQPAISTLTRLGLGTKLGTVPRNTKGKPATIWGFNTGTLDAAFSVAPIDAVNVDASAANDATNDAEEDATA